jgi:hypothetical protein
LSTRREKYAEKAEWEVESKSGVREGWEVIVSERRWDSRARRMICMCQR